MTGQRRVLLTPGALGPGEWVDVAHRLDASGCRVLIDTGLRYDRGMQAGAAAQLERLRDDALWTSFGVDHVDLAVGLGLGAGPAAAMVVEGRATSAVLVDPDLTTFAMAHPDDLDDLLAPDTRFELAEEIAGRLEPFRDHLAHGPVTRTMVDILCGAFSGQPWRVRQADLVAPFLMDRVTVDRFLRSTDADLRAADWAPSATAAPVRLWLSAGSESIAGSLRRHGLDVTVTAWGPAPWLESTEELSAAIEREARTGGCATSS